jgi:hypothetical protein
MSFTERLTNGFLWKMFNHSWEFCLQIISIKSYHFRAVSVIKKYCTPKSKIFSYAAFCLFAHHAQNRSQKLGNNFCKENIDFVWKVKTDHAITLPWEWHSFSLCLSVCLSLPTICFLSLSSFLPNFFFFLVPFHWSVQM